MNPHALDKAFECQKFTASITVACPGGVLWVLKHPSRADPKKKKRKKKEREGKKERKGEREGKKESKQ